MTNRVSNDGRAFGQWTRVKGDLCAFENHNRLANLPFQYTANVVTTPQIRANDPIQTFTEIGNMKQYNVRNMDERPKPTQLNPLPSVYNIPYATSPFLGAAHEAREFVDDGTKLQTAAPNSLLRPLRSGNDLTGIIGDYWHLPSVDGRTVQNAGQYTDEGQTMGLRSGKVEHMSRVDGNTIEFKTLLGPMNGNGTQNEITLWNPNGDNNVIWANSAYPWGGMSSRNMAHNALQINGC